MSFTNKTPNYNLPQWLGTDKPSYLVDFNNAFSDIDTGMKNNKDTADNASATASTALTTAQSAQETATTASGLASQAVEAANNATTIANNANTQAGTALSEVNKISNVAKWKKIFVPISDIVVANGLAIDTSVYGGGLTMFYNETLKLLQLSLFFRLTEKIGTLTTYIPTSGYNSFPIVKLPMTITGDLMWYSGIIGNQDINITTGTTGRYYAPRPFHSAIISYNNSAYLALDGASTNTTINLSDGNITNISVPPVWLQVSSLGNITLDGWQDVN